MVDNITAPAIGTVLATDEIGGVHYPRTKVSFGVDGAVMDVSVSAPLPVALLNTVAVTGSFFPATQPISATSLPLPAGAATAAGVAATASADDIFAITPSDSTDLATIPKALLVTIAGNLAVRGIGGTAVTVPVTAGQIVPLRARRVMATNTTATVVGLV